MNAHIRLTEEAAKLRERRRLTEEEFLRMSRESGTVILDARSAQMYGLLHVKGAVQPELSRTSRPRPWRA